MRSRKVRRIVRLEAQALAWRKRHERARTRMELFRRRMAACLSEARAVEASLTASEREDLQGARTVVVSAPSEEGPGCRA